MKWVKLKEDHFNNYDYLFTNPYLPLNGYCLIKDNIMWGKIIEKVELKGKCDYYLEDLKRYEKANEVWVVIYKNRCYYFKYLKNAKKFLEDIIKDI